MRLIRLIPLLATLTIAMGGETKPPAQPELPVVYNYVEGEPNENDIAINKAYEKTHLIKNAFGEKTFEAGDLISGEPLIVRDAKGVAKRGYVRIVYIVSEAGEASSPVVVQSTDSTLEEPAKAAVLKFKFEPSRIAGKPVAFFGSTGLYFKSDEIPPVEKPKSYHTRALEPLHGEITVPDGWYFADYPGEHGYRWVISKEDTSFQQDYLTGMNIQFFVGIKKNTGKSPREFCEEAMAGFEKTSKKVIRKWPASQQGIFTRIGLEVEDEKFHTIYSFFYGSNENDMSACTVVGAPKEQWADYSPTFEKMLAVKLIDMEKLKSEAKPAPVETK